MHFPIEWDPYFRDCMTVQDVLHYATQHYQRHRRQLTLSTRAPSESPGDRCPGGRLVDTLAVGEPVLRLSP